MIKKFTVRIKNDTGIPQAMEKYCFANDIPINAFIKQAILEKLSKTNIHSMTVAEIEQKEREYNERIR